jgi:hypothetical protein
MSRFEKINANKRKLFCLLLFLLGRVDEFDQAKAGGEADD